MLHIGVGALFRGYSFCEIYVYLEHRNVDKTSQKTPVTVKYLHFVPPNTLA